jgi:hypothetical protein
VRHWVFRAEPGKEDVVLRIAAAYVVRARMPAWEGTDLDDLLFAQGGQFVLREAEQLAVNHIGIGPQ